MTKYTFETVTGTRNVPQEVAEQWLERMKKKGADIREYRVSDTRTDYYVHYEGTGMNLIKETF